MNFRTSPTIEKKDMGEDAAEGSYKKKWFVTSQKLIKNIYHQGTLVDRELFAIYL